MNRNQCRLRLLGSQTIRAIRLIKTIRRLKTSGIVRWEGVKQCQIHGIGEWKNSRSEYSSNEHNELDRVKKKSIIQSTNSAVRLMPIISHNSQTFWAKLICRFRLASRVCPFWISIQRVLIDEIVAYVHLLRL